MGVRRSKEFQGGHGGADRLRKTSQELDRNVIEMLPLFEPTEAFTPTTRSLCRGLLHKNAKYRLGAAPGGFEEIKEHPWFDCIDWALLEAGYLTSPHIPERFEVQSSSNLLDDRPTMTNTRKFRLRASLTPRSPPSRGSRAKSFRMSSSMSYKK